MQKLPASSPHFASPQKLMRDGSPIHLMLFHPRIDGWILLDGAVESAAIASSIVAPSSAFVVCG